MTAFYGLWVLEKMGNCSPALTRYIYTNTDSYMLLVLLIW